MWFLNTVCLSAAAVSVTAAQQETCQILNSVSWPFSQAANRVITHTHTLTVTVAAGRLHQPAVLVVAHHGLVAVALSTLLDVSLDLHPQDALHPASLGQDAVRPVPHWLGVVLVTGTVLGLAQRVHLRVLALVFLLAPP